MENKRKNPGIVFKLIEDSRHGIAYTNEQKPEFGQRYFIKLITYPDFKPVFSPHTNKQLTVFKSVDKLKIIGFVD